MFNFGDIIQNMFAQKANAFSKTFDEFLIDSILEPEKLEAESAYVRQLVNACKPINDAFFSLIQRRKLSIETLSSLRKNYVQAARNNQAPRDYFDCLLAFAIYILNQGLTLGKIGSRKMEKLVLLAAEDFATHGDKLYEDYFRIVADDTKFKFYVSHVCEVPQEQLFGEELPEQPTQQKEDRSPQPEPPGVVGSNFAPLMVRQISMEQFQQLLSQKSVSGNRQKVPVLTVNEELVLRSYYELYRDGNKFPSLEQLKSNLKEVFGYPAEEFWLQVLVEALKSKKMIESDGMLSTKGFELMRG